MARENRTTRTGRGLARRSDLTPEADRIQELYLAKRKDEAIAAVPDEFVDSGALIGPKERIADRFRAWEDSGVTGLTISGNSEAIKTMAEVARLNFPS